MKVRSCLASPLAGLALLALVSVGSPMDTSAGTVGFAAGGATAAGTYPVGEATGLDPAVAGNGASSLGIGIPINTSIIDNYMYAGTGSWLAPALAAEGYSAANGWTINYQTLKDNDLSLTVYQAYMDQGPALGLGGMEVGPIGLSGGGAAIALGYSPGADAITAGDPDPSRSYLNWIQVVATNAPSTFGTGNANGIGLGGGNTAYIDDGYLSGAGNGYDGPLPNNPFYGGVRDGVGAYAGNSQAFLDEPGRGLPAPGQTVDWQAQVFLASWSPNVSPTDNNTDDAGAVISGGGTITIYDGVWWGFQIVPEPGTYVMIISGSLFGLLMWSCRAARRRRNERRAPDLSCAA